MIELWLPPKPAIIRPASDELRRDWRRPATNESSFAPKQANFLPGWFPGGAVAGPAGPDLSFLSGNSNTANQASYTFSSLSFGAAAANRLLIVAIAGGSSGGSGANLSSVTIGGVSATIHAQANNNNNTRNGHAAVVSALVTAGTSGDIVINWAFDLGLMNENSYALYRVTGLVSTTPTDTATDTGGSPTLSIDRSNLGFIVGAAAAVSASSVTWPSPLTTDFSVSADGVFASLAHTPVTGGAVTNFSAGPSTVGGAAPSRYAAASWA